MIRHDWSVQGSQEVNDLSRTGSHSNGRGGGVTTTDQLSDIFDFSKVPDIDSVTRKHMGSEWLHL